MIKAKANFAPLRRELSKLASRVTGPELQLAVNAGALVIMNSAKQKAPVLDGTLRRSIHIGGYNGASGSTPDGKNRFGDIGPAEVKSGTASADIGTNLIYAATHEFGDPSRNIRQQAYLRPALAENEAAALTAIRAVLLKMIK